MSSGKQKSPQGRLLAERVGFEPTRPHKGRRLATCSFKPLRHLSLLVNNALFVVFFQVPINNRFAFCDFLC